MRTALFALLLFSAEACAQSEAPLPVLTAGFGGGWTFKFYPDADFSYVCPGGINFDAGLAWRVSDFFGVSLDAGSSAISSQDGFVDGNGLRHEARLSLGSVWIAAGLCLRFAHFSIEPGAAFHMVRSEINAFGEQSHAEKLDPSYALRVSYYIALGERVSLTAGVAVHYLTDLQLCLILPRVGLDVALLY